MRKKLICIFFCIILLIMMFSSIVPAGDENDPEIKDNFDDQFGALIQYPTRIRTRIALLILQMNSFDFIDIDSAWFHENEFESDYLYTAVKLKDLEPNSQRGIYSIHWTFNGVSYAAWSHLHNDGENSLGHVGLDKRFTNKFNDAEVSYDFNRNIVEFKINKEHIGNPKPGDILTSTYAWTALRFYFEPLCLFFSDGELVKDCAPFMENNDEYGRNYMIKY